MADHALTPRDVRLLLHATRSPDRSVRRTAQRVLSVEALRLYSTLRTHQTAAALTAFYVLMQEIEDHSKRLWSAVWDHIDCETGYSPDGPHE